MGYASFREGKSLNFILATKHVIPESLKFSHWLSEILLLNDHELETCEFSDLLFGDCKFPR